MTIQLAGVGAQQPAGGVRHVGGGDQFRTRMHDAIGAVAKLFGETPDQLKAELDGGKTSLLELAKRKGVSKDQLLSAIKTAVQTSGGNTKLSPDQLTNLANRIAMRVHGRHHHRGAGAAGNANGTVVQGVASGTSGSDDDKSGAHLASISGAGVASTSTTTDSARAMFTLRSSPGSRDGDGDNDAGATGAAESPARALSQAKAAYQAA